MEELGKRITSEVTESTHKGVAEAAEVGAILCFLGENVAGIVFASHVKDLEIIILSLFKDSILPEFHMTDVLHGDIVGPFHTSFILVVNSVRSQVVRELDDHADQEAK